MAHSDDTGGAPDTEQLYDECKTAETSLHNIASGLGQIGAAPEAVKAVEQMAAVVGKICDGLAKGMKEEPAEPAHTPPEGGHTISSATDEMMADARARRSA